MKKFLSLLCIIMLVFGLLGGADAVLFSLDDSIYGAGSITRDTDSGLDWLDLTLSTDHSFNYVSTQFGIGGDFEGFRYAKASELEGLFYSVGISDIDMSYTEDKFKPAKNLLTFMGTTGSDSNSDSSHGLLADVFEPGRRREGTFSVTFSPERGTANISGTTEESTKEFFLGSFLVRDASSPIPEPSSYLLFLFGILGVVGVKKKFSNRN